jgi:hypothetical protein
MISSIMLATFCSERACSEGVQGRLADSHMETRSCVEKVGVG